jgi:hypothetical protein
MTVRWVSDASQRRSKRYQAILRELRTGEPAAHLQALPAYPPHRITYSGICPDKHTRHLERSEDFRKRGDNP